VPPFRNYEVLFLIFLEILVLELLEEFSRFLIFLLLGIDLTIDKPFDESNRFFTFIFVLDLTTDIVLGKFNQFLFFLFTELFIIAQLLVEFNRLIIFPFHDLMMIDQIFDEFNSIFSLILDLGLATINSDIKSENFKQFWQRVTKSYQIKTRAVYRVLVRFSVRFSKDIKTTPFQTFCFLEHSRKMEAQAILLLLNFTLEV